MSLDDDAIGGQGGTGQYPYPIPYLEGLGGHLMVALFIDQGGHDGNQASQVGARLRGLAPCPQLEKASKQQEEDKHGDGVVIDLPRVEDGGPDGGDEGTYQRQRHRHIHGELALTQAAPGTHVKWLGRINHDGGREQEADPLEIDHELLFDTDEEVHIEGHGAHHHLHGPQARQPHPIEVTLHLAGIKGFLLMGLEGVGAIAYPGKALENVAQG